MRLSDAVIFSVENVQRGGKKSFLSIIAIAVGIFSVCLISGLGEAAADEVELRVSETGLGGITIYPDSSEQQRLISDETIDMISESVDGLKAISPFVIYTGSISQRKGTKSSAIIGVNNSISKIFNIDMLYGDYFTPEQVSSKAKVIIVDNTFAESMYERENIIGKQISVNIENIRQNFEVIGVIRSQKKGIESLAQMSLPNIIYMPYTTLNELTGHSLSDKIAISCFSSYDENTIAEEITQKLTFENQAKYVYENINGYISGLWEIIDIVKLFIKAVAAISLLVGGIGIMNCMLYTIDSRRSDIGICMALGETKRSILGRFLSESVILCACGGMLGIGLTFSAVFILRECYGLSLNIQTTTFIYSGLLSLICGLTFGIVPAYNAAKLDPIDVIIR